MTAKPLFIFGAARSGTSFFSRLLRDYFDYGLGPEAKFLIDLAHRADQFGDLKHDHALHTLIDHLLTTEMVQIVSTRYSHHFQKDMRIRREDVLRHVGERSYPQVVLALLATIGERMGKTRVGNKFPDYWKHLPQLLSWYPDAQFIHLLRDGRDVALSTQKMSWGPNTIYAGACEWKRMFNRVEDFSARLPPSQFLCLRYEDLLLQPEASYSKLCEFLTTTPDHTHRQGFVAELSRSGPGARQQRWPSQMSERKLRLYEGVAGEQLLKGGYGVRVHQQPIGWSEHLYYQLEDYSRRAWYKTHNLLKPA